MRGKACLTAIVLAVVLGSLALADEGRIPIYQPTTITQPGHYVVTRDFSSPGTAINIGANRVTLDLGGHTLTTSVAGSNVINIDTTSASTGLVIRNGVIKGGFNGILSNGFSPIQIRIQNVETDGSSGSGMYFFNPGSVEVIDCHIHDASTNGIGTPSSPSTFKGRFIGNTIERVGDYGMSLVGLRAGEVRRNLISDFGINGPGRAGIYLVAPLASSEAGGNLIQGNTVSSYPSGTDDDGIVISQWSRNSLVLENVTRQNGRYGIWSQADGTRLEQNVASANGSHGILIGLDASFGARSYLAGNQAQDNLSAGSCGVYFQNGQGHSYRNNNLRGNAVAGFCGAPNTDAGGNIQ